MEAVAVGHQSCLEGVGKHRSVGLAGAQRLGLRGRAADNHHVVVAGLQALAAQDRLEQARHAADLLGDGPPPAQRGQGRHVGAGDDGRDGTVHDAGDDRERRAALDRGHDVVRAVAGDVDAARFHAATPPPVLPVANGSISSPSAA